MYLVTVRIGKSTLKLAMISQGGRHHTLYACFANVVIIHLLLKKE